MTAFFDFIFGQSGLKEVSCESTIASSSTENTTIKQEKTAESAKTSSSVENLALPFEMLYQAENGLKNGTPAKSPSTPANKANRPKSNRKSKKFANDSSSEVAASDKSPVTDTSSNRDSPQFTSTPQNTVSKKQQKLQNFKKNQNLKNSIDHTIPSLFDPIDATFLRADASTAKSSNSDLSQGQAPQSVATYKQQRRRTFENKQNWKNSSTRSIPSLFDPIDANLLHVAANAGTGSISDLSRGHVPQTALSKKQQKRQNFINNRNQNNSAGIPSVFDPVEDSFSQPRASGLLLDNKPPARFGQNERRPNGQSILVENQLSEASDLSKRFDRINPKKKPATMSQNPSHANNFNNFNNPNFNPMFAQRFYSSDFNPKSFAPYRAGPLEHGMSNRNPNQFANQYHANFGRSFQHPKNVLGPKKFVKLSEAENESLRNVHFAPGNPKGYKTNQFHYRNPNWKAEPNQQTSNTTTTTTTPATASSPLDAVDEVLKKSNKSIRARGLVANEVVNDFDTALQVLQLMSDEECTQDEAVQLVTGHTKQVQCQVCCLSFERNDIETMLSCNHECCVSCAKNHFTEQIRNKSLKCCVCFACDEPKWLSGDLSASSDRVMDYFGMLDIVLRRLLDTEVHDIFQNKLRDFGLAKEDNFKWCSNCSFGYFVDKTSNIKFVVCESCSFASCIHCSLEWKSQHEKISCEQFKKWLEDNDEQLHKTTMKNYIEQNGIACPKCKFQYVLARGGCMHFTCHQCKHEFCYGCNKPFYRDSTNCRTSYCQKLGLHAHHPMNCLFYLRDKEPAKLKELLLNNKIDFLSTCDDVKNCPIPLQKEDDGVLHDEVCNEPVTSTNQAGLCEKHYIEYLVQLIFKNNLDCSPIMTSDEIQAAKTRSAF